MLKITNLSSLHTVKPPHPMWNWLDSNKICGKGEEKICAGSDSLHAEMIYAKSLAAALFTFGNARLEISKAKQKGQQTTVSGACCGTLVFFFFLLLLFSLSDTCSASSAPALFPLTSKTRPFRLNEGAHQRCWMHPLLLVNNTYLAGRPKGLFFAFKSPPSSSLHLAGFTCWQQLTRHHGNGFFGLCCWREIQASTHTQDQTTFQFHTSRFPQLCDRCECSVAKCVFSFVFMAFTSVDFTFHWYFSIFFTIHLHL